MVTLYKRDGLGKASAASADEVADAITPATQTTQGAMSANDKSKLDHLTLQAGEGVPSDDLGWDGDTYIDLITMDVYNKVDGTWTYSFFMQHGTPGFDGWLAGPYPGVHSFYENGRLIYTVGGY